MKDRVEELEQDNASLMSEGHYQLKKRRGANDLIKMMTTLQKNKNAAAQVIDDIVSVAKKQGEYELYIC